jgi:hypothetical protein
VFGVPWQVTTYGDTLLAPDAVPSPVDIIDETQPRKEFQTFARRLFIVTSKICKGKIDDDPLFDESRGLWLCHVVVRMPAACQNP